MKSMDLLQGEPRKLFFKYLIPSISATLVTSIYVLADTIMIGKGVGASALATLNLILPVFTLLFGTGLLLGLLFLPGSAKVQQTPRRHID